MYRSLLARSSSMLCKRTAPSTLPTASTLSQRHMSTISLFSTQHISAATNTLFATQSAVQSLVQQVNETVNAATNLVKDVTSKVMSASAELGDRSAGSTVYAKPTPSPSDEVKNNTEKVNQEADNAGDEMLKRTDKKAKNAPKAQKYEDNKPDGHPSANKTSHDSTASSSNVQD